MVRDGRTLAFTMLVPRVRKDWQLGASSSITRFRSKRFDRLITGELDMNTPMAQAEDFYRALKPRGVPTVLVRFPDEYHGPYGVKPSNVLRHQLYLRRWFERFRR